MPIQSKPVFILENLNPGRYPSIEIGLRENFSHPLNTSNLILAEEMDGIRTIPADLEIRREKELEPIQLIFSVQPTDSRPINQWSTDLIISASTMLMENDRLSVHIQEMRRFLYLSNQTTNTLESGLILPSVDVYSNTLETISTLLDKLSINGKKYPFLVLIIHSKSIPDKEKLVDLTKKSRQMGIPIHVLGFPSIENQKIAEYSDGKFYSLKDKDSTQKLFADIQQYRMPPYRIRYTSKNKVSILEEKKITVHLGILNLQNINSEYEVSIPSRMENAIRDPYVFLPVAIFILMICLTALFLLPKIRYPKFINSKTDVSEDRSSSIDESRVYEHMYGKKEEHDSKESAKRIHTNILDYEDVEMDIPNSIPGEKYKKAVLIQKSGPNPGRQFTVFGEKTIIGKRESCDFVIWDNSVDGEHAKILNIKDHFVIYDLISSSGVYLNGKKLLRPKVLFDFDEIKLGKTVLIFRGK
jgi:hypothetical protein